MINDPAYLRKEQYRDTTNLNARQRLHMHYSLEQDRWFDWVFEQMELSPGWRVLEVGCGPGNLWRENLHRLPHSTGILLSDFSPGMLAQAAQHLAGQAFTFACLDAQHLPFPENHFDALIGNHMLYHLPDLARGLREMLRVLKPGGRLYAATNGESHMQELAELAARFDPTQAKDLPSFYLENGKAHLEGVFEQVASTRLDSHLSVPDAQPLVDYLLSMSSIHIDRSREVELHQFIEAEIERQGGAIHISRSPGLFTAFKPLT